MGSRNRWFQPASTLGFAREDPQLKIQVARRRGKAVKFKNVLIKRSVQFVLAVSAWMARQERLSAVTEAFMNALARATIRSKRIREVDTLEALGAQWQRGFPSAKQVPITAVTADTVFAEIHTPCPLRGTGDVGACYRMIQFDREVVMCQRAR